MLPFQIKPAALADLESIADFIQRDHPARAASFSDELAGKIETVAERPLSFPARPELGAGVRSALHGNHLIIVVFENERVEILRVLHGARDIENLF